MPLVGRVTAGLPILALENIEEHLVLPQSMLGRDEGFCLRVQGESMIEAGIMDGDIVVALVEDEATLKRIFYEENRVRLQPENHTMEPIYVDRAAVLGKLVALIRQF